MIFLIHRSIIFLFKYSDRQVGCTTGKPSTVDVQILLCLDQLLKVVELDRVNNHFVLAVQNPLGDVRISDELMYVFCMAALLGINLAEKITPCSLLYTR